MGAPCRAGGMSLCPVSWEGPGSSPLPPLPLRAGPPYLTWAWAPTPPVLQVKASLDALAQKTATFTDVGNSLAHAEHLLKDLGSFEEKSSVRTAVWARVGRGHPGGGAQGTTGVT